MELHMHKVERAATRRAGISRHRRDTRGRRVLRLAEICHTYVAARPNQPEDRRRPPARPCDDHQNSVSVSLSSLHHLHELLEIDLPTPVLVNIAKDLGDLLREPPH